MILEFGKVLFYFSIIYPFILTLWVIGIKAMVVINFFGENNESNYWY